LVEVTPNVSGQITAIPAVSGTLARTSAFGGGTTFPAMISIPYDMNRDML
jgi:hypothetical protein